MVTKKLTFCDLNFKKELLGDIHKPRGQLRGEDSLMTILLHIPYLVKVTTKEGGGSKIPKILTMWFMDDP